MTSNQLWNLEIEYKISGNPRTLFIKATHVSAFDLAQDLPSLQHAIKLETAVLIHGRERVEIHMTSSKACGRLRRASHTHGAYF